MPSSAREWKVYPCIPRLTECFGSGPSGGNVLVPARTLRRSRLKGRCRKAAPLGSTESPGRIAGTAKKYFRLLLVVLSKNSEKYVVIASQSADWRGNPSPRPPWLPLWGSCHEVAEKAKSTLSASGTSPIGRGKTLIRLALA